MVFHDVILSELLVINPAFVSSFVIIAEVLIINPALVGPCGFVIIAEVLTINLALVSVLEDKARLIKSPVLGRSSNTPTATFQLQAIMSS